MQFDDKSENFTFSPEQKKQKSGKKAKFSRKRSYVDSSKESFTNESISKMKSLKKNQFVKLHEYFDQPVIGATPLESSKPYFEMGREAGSQLNYIEERINIKNKFLKKPFGKTKQ